MNLLVNSIQAIDGKGTITISTKLDKGDIVILFEDTGRGISAEHQKKIFDPGFTTKGVGVGTGLGLSISYRIIEAHKGTLSVSSRMRSGSAFEIRLPKS